MKYDIVVLKRKMLVKYPFFGSVVVNVNYKEDKEIPTAGTNGKTIYYNPDFLESLSVEQQTFLFAHEVCHIAFNHILRGDDKNLQIWNIATDAVINAFLKRDGLKMIDGAVDIEEAIDYDAEQLYEKLLQEKKYHEETKENAGHDTHSMWEAAIKKHKEEHSEDKKNEVEKKQKECEGLGEKDAFKKI